MLPSPLSSVVFPSIDGSLSIPDIVDFNIRNNPSEVAFLFSYDDQPDSITQITHLEFGHAIHRAAHIVRPDGKGQDGSVVAILAVLDTIVYQALVLGLARAGLVPFPISPRNSAAGIASLLRATSCHRILVTPGTLGELVEEVQSQLLQGSPDFELKVEIAPSIQLLYPYLGEENSEDAFTLYPPLHRNRKRTDILMYLHSSGSTGFPRPIPHSVRSTVEWAAVHLSNVRTHLPRLRIGVMALPPFHSTGFYLHILYPVCGLVSVCVFPPAIWSPMDQLPPPTPENILQQLRRTQANAVLLIPMMLEGMVKSLDNIDFFRNFEFVAYGAGPMPQSLGDSLASFGINLQSAYGSTETGPLTMVQFRRDRELHWEWTEFSEKVNMRWAPQGDGTFEAQILTSEIYHPSVENLDDVKGYATSDLFVPHPTLERFWKIVGRVDDVIVHTSGEKTVPAPMERMMTTNSIIQGAVMFGHGHDQTGVLLEPVEELIVDVHDQMRLSEFRNRAWSIVEAANKDAPAFSRIYKEMILMSSPDKPLPRSAKGTIMRKAALASYEKEIDALYQTVELNTAGDHIPLPDSWERGVLKAWLLQQATDIQSGRYIDPSRDLFEQGFDSLSATFLRLRIVGALRQTQKPTDSLHLQNIMYTHPILDDLAGYLSNPICRSKDAEPAVSATEAIENMIAKHSIGLEKPFEGLNFSSQVPSNHVVLLTGATGNLGSQILEQLLRRSDVTRVYALNRCSESSPIFTRIERRFKDKGLDAELLHISKLVLLEGDLTQEGFGLRTEIYDQVQNLVTIIIHAAWRLDFNLTLASFEHSIRGTRNLIDFARAGPHATFLRFLYTSSVGSAQSWATEHGPYPEEIVYDTSAAVGAGYGESKYVAERILVNSGLHVTSIRIGQISGGLPNGAWATSDWVPILIKSSLAIGALPNAPGVLSWLPMDIAAQCIIDMTFFPQPLPIAVNLVHPKPIPWSTMFSHVRDVLLKRLGIGEDSLPMIPFRDWVQQLEAQEKGANEDSLRDVPAIKLLDFFRKLGHANDRLLSDRSSSLESGGFAIFATDKAQHFSPTLHKFDKLSIVDADRWVNYWTELGFLS